MEAAEDILDLVEVHFLRWILLIRCEEVYALEFVLENPTYNIPTHYLFVVKK